MNSDRDNLSGTAELDIRAVFQFLRTYWLTLLLSTVLGGVFGVAVSFFLKPLYKADAVLIASDESSGSGTAANLSSELGGFAALAGFSGARNGQLNEAIATLKSRALTEHYIEQQNLLPILFAQKWDPKTQRWRTAKAPTAQDGYRLFDEKIRTVTEEKKAGLISVSVTWSDPQLSAKWLTDLVNETNEYLRLQAIQRSNQNLNYLNEQLNKASVVELRVVVSKLIEGEIKKVMVAEGSREYAFRFIDPPVVPDKKIFPKRTLFFLGGAFLSFFLASLFAYLRDQSLSKLI
jgi:uncharacterized protein involved in exopolysaccharide biosynthesis